MSEPRCEITELITSQCACPRHRGNSGHTSASVEITSRFTAQWDGRCTAGIGSCDGAFLAGERIGRTEDGDYVCCGCADELAGAA